MLQYIWSITRTLLTKVVWQCSICRWIGSCLKLLNLELADDEALECCDINVYVKWC